WNSIALNDTLSGYRSDTEWEAELDINLPWAFRFMQRDLHARPRRKRNCRPLLDFAERDGHAITGRSDDGATTINSKYHASSAGSSQTSASMVQGKLQKRLTLPVIMHSASGPISVTTTPDSGSQTNIISRSLAATLGLPITSLDPEEGKFCLANGKFITSQETTRITCSFSAQGALSDAVEAVAFVFQNLVIPAIMGADCLHKMKVFTEHRDCLSEELVPVLQPQRSNSVGKALQSLVCQLGLFFACAQADTGSDVDLISTEFTPSRGLEVLPWTERLEFADGSFGFTTGIVETKFAAGIVDPIRGIFPTLTIFLEHPETLIPGRAISGQFGCNIIRYIGKLERRCQQVVDAARQFVKRKRPTNNGELAKEDMPFSTLTLVSFLDTGLEIQRQNARRGRQETVATLQPGISTTEDYLGGGRLLASEICKRILPPNANLFGQDATLLADYSSPVGGPDVDLGPTEPPLFASTDDSSDEFQTVEQYFFSNREAVLISNPGSTTYHCTFHGCAEPLFPTSDTLNSHMVAHIGLLIGNNEGSSSGTSNSCAPARSAFGNP
ncbi:hypothetical protein QBC36DRAFT_369480, partial [Triangularia setosa]